MKKIFTQVGSMHISPSPGLDDFLSTHKVSLLFIFDIANKLTRIVTVSAGDKSAVYELVKPDIPLCHTAAAISEDHQKIWLAGATIIYRFKNQLSDEYKCERTFLQQATRPIGNLYPRDLGFDKKGDCVFITKNSAFQGIVSYTKTGIIKLFTEESLKALLLLEKPKKAIITGMALRDGLPRYVSYSITAEEKSLERICSRGIIDIIEQKFFTQEGFVPLLPRWHNDRLWFFNKEDKTLGYILPDFSQYHPVCTYSGDPKSLIFYDDTLIMSTTIAGGATQVGILMESILSFLDIPSGEIRFTIKIPGITTILKDLHILPIENIKLIHTEDPRYLQSTCLESETIEAHYSGKEDAGSNSTKKKYNLTWYSEERERQERIEEIANRTKYRSSIGFWQRTKPSPKLVWAALLFWAAALSAIMIGMAIGMRSLEDDTESGCNPTYFRS